MATLTIQEICAQVVSNHAYVSLTVKNLLAVQEEIQRLSVEERRKAQKATVGTLFGLFDLYVAVAVPLAVDEQLEYVEEVLLRAGIPPLEILKICYVFKKPMSTKAWNHLLSQAFLETQDTQIWQICEMDQTATAGKRWTIADLAHLDPDLFLRFASARNIC